MCVICQNGPALLGGAPFTGRALARIRRALTVRGGMPEPNLRADSPEPGAGNAR